MKNSPKLAAGAVVAALLLSGCVAPGHQAVSPAPACHTGDPMMQTTLYFGLNRPAAGDHRRRVANLRRQPGDAAF